MVLEGDFGQKGVKNCFFLKKIEEVRSNQKK